ncbi:MAG: hypothetical protein P1U50_14350 [Parvibaculaceae bacterium]|nr:hypothetical protein [Parvibaculaceae bacterium]
MRSFISAELTGYPLGKSLSLLIGWILFVSGLILTPLPPPFAFGLFLLMPGLALLIVHSSYMRRSVRYLRQKYSAVDRAASALEDRVPAQMRRVLKLTRPITSPSPSRPHPSKEIAK